MMCETSIGYAYVSYTLQRSFDFTFCFFPILITILLKVQRMYAVFS